MVNSETVQALTSMTHPRKLSKELIKFHKTVYNAEYFMLGLMVANTNSQAKGRSQMNPAVYLICYEYLMKISFQYFTGKRFSSRP